MFQGQPSHSSSNACSRHPRGLLVDVDTHHGSKCKLALIEAWLWVGKTDLRFDFAFRALELRFQGDIGNTELRTSKMRTWRIWSGQTDTSA